MRDLHAVLDGTERSVPDGGLDREGPDVLLARDGERTLLASLQGWTGRPTARLVVGPEGGLEASERGLLEDAGYRVATLGPRTLRFETAAVAAMAAAGQLVERD